jgi:hypothetical protein
MSIIIASGERYEAAKSAWPMAVEHWLDAHLGVISRNDLQDVASSKKTKHKTKPATKRQTKEPREGSDWRGMLDWLMIAGASRWANHATHIGLGLCETALSLQITDASSLFKDATLSWSLLFVRESARVSQHRVKALFLTHFLLSGCGLISSNG